VEGALGSLRQEKPKIRYLSDARRILVVVSYERTTRKSAALGCQRRNVARQHLLEVDEVHVQDRPSQEVGLMVEKPQTVQETDDTPASAPDSPIGASSNTTVPLVRNAPVNNARCTLIEESRGCEDDQVALQGA
jgi:hypothetical protein